MSDLTGAVEAETRVDGPAQHERLRSAQVRAVGSAFFRFRAWLVVPSALLGLVWFRLAGVSGAQLAALGMSFGLVSVYFVYEAWRARRVLVSERRLFVSLLVTLVALAAGVLQSGGLDSPALPLLFAPTVTAFAAFGRRRQSIYMLLALFALVVVVAAWPGGAPFPPVAGPWRVVLLCQFALVSAALLLFSVAGLTEAFAAAGSALERLREASVAEVQSRARSVDAVGARVAHEVKNPLTAVKNLVELVESESQDERARRRLAVVRGEVERIEVILRDYLSFARPLEGLTAAPVELAGLLEGVASLLHMQLDRMNVALALASAPAWVEGDGPRLQAALLNVLLNALHASPQGGRVEVNLRTEGEVVELTVRDHGDGLTPEALERAGEPFFTTKPGGTGLGLATARATLAEHGGSLVLENAKGGGARVTLRLPVRRGSAARAEGRREA